MDERPSIFGADPDQIDKLLAWPRSKDAKEAPMDAHEQSADDRGRQDGGGRPTPAERGSDEAGPSEGQRGTAWVGGLMERLGTRVGQYKLLRILGEGGMGMVYLAEQEGAIRRKVALKVIKPGMDSKRVIARFENERQALALLDHPNIAQVHDAGTTEGGRPYFVMEYVKGLPVTEYCDRHKLTIEDRLRLFQQVCLAVHHAHQKGIIHRDLKPSNVLVLTEGDKAIPKIIDFGVAKAMSQPLTERTLFTEDSQLLGTPEYMSPEQAEMINDDIDTRSDIYSLGVLLYVLLVGIMPYDSETFRQGGVEHVRKTIRESDPKTPSTRLTKLGDEARRLAESRRTEVAALAKRLQKELEWLPLKAMRKERAERYRSASEFADDIENYLKGDPLIAGPLSTVYRLKKFVRRNRSLVTGIAAVLAILVAGVVVSTLFALRAQRQARISNAISSLLLDDLLASVDPARGRGRDVTVRSFLDTTSESLDGGRFKNEPLVEASIRHTLGWTYRQIDELKSAEVHLERALQIRREQLGAEHPDTLESVGLLVWLYMDQGRDTEAADLLEEGVATCRRIFGDEDVRTLSLTNPLGVAYIKSGCYDEAEHLYLKNIPIALRVLGVKKDLSLFMVGNLGQTYEFQGRYDEAERQYLQLLRLREGFWGDEIMWTLSYKGMLARLYGKQRQYDKAKRLYLDILPIQRRELGDEHRITLRTANGLGQVYTLLGDYDKAESHFQEALKSQERKLGSDHPNTLMTLNNFGVLRREQGRYEDAEKLLIDALNGRQVKFDKHHPECLESKHELALVYIARKDYEKGEPLLLEAYNGREIKLGPKHPHTVDSLKQLVALYESWRRPDEAAKWRVKLAARVEGEGSDK